MCFLWLKKKENLPKPLVIPHPEEQVDYFKTIENTNSYDVLAEWLAEWEVPQELWDYWTHAVTITISLQYPSPSAISTESRQMWIRPEWAFPGVVAHEMAHVAYSLLTQTSKDHFKFVYNELVTTDLLLMKLHSERSYMDASIVEAHAEIYRYLGQSMPTELRRFYPNLL
jgi:hypothetical protein